MLPCTNESAAGSSYESGREPRQWPGTPAHSGSASRTSSSPCPGQSPQSGSMWVSLPPPGKRLTSPAHHYSMLSWCYIGCQTMHFAPVQPSCKGTQPYAELVKSAEIMQQWHPKGPQEKMTKLCPDHSSRHRHVASFSVAYPTCLKLVMANIYMAGCAIKIACYTSEVSKGIPGSWCQCKR